MTKPTKIMGGPRLLCYPENIKRLTTVDTPKTWVLIGGVFIKKKKVAAARTAEICSHSDGTPRQTRQLSIKGRPKKWIFSNEPQKYRAVDSRSVVGF